MLGRGGDQGGIEGVLVGAGDGDLGEEGEGDGVVEGAEGGDLLIGAGLLTGEVVGREAEDEEAAIFVLLVESFEGGVLRGEAALGGDVHDEENLAGVVGEGGGSAGDGSERDRGEGGHGDSLAEWLEDFRNIRGAVRMLCWFLELTVIREQGRRGAAVRLCPSDVYGASSTG